MSLTKYILPYPYEPYTEFNSRFFEDFNTYKNAIYKWVEESTSKTMNIEQAFSYVEDSKSNRDIKTWLLNHTDKLKYVGDFSGLAFGIQFDERNETLSIYYPWHVMTGEVELYPNYDEKEFRNMNDIDRLEWMYSYCEFIPFRIIYEYISTNEDSYKFSHIKKDKSIMGLIQNYLENLEFRPRDDTYYFIMFDVKSNRHYLKRDLEKSPKIKKNSLGGTYYEKGQI